jgi:hypothetical protein
MKHLYIFTCFLTISAFSARAQLKYSFTALSGTYAAISGGTNPTVIPADPQYPPHDEGIANGIPIGFTFRYNDTNYTTINANTNGFASFRTLTPVTDPANQYYYASDLGYGPAAPTNARPLLAPLWDDLDLYSTADLKYITTGVAPNRVFTLEWGKVYWDIAAVDLNIEFQLKLYETTNVVEFQYHRLSGAVGSAASAAIGITATDTGTGKYLALTDASASPVATSTQNVYTINTKPAEGQIYRFTPAAALPLTLTSFTGEAKNGVNLLKWITMSEQNNNGFELQRSADGVNFSTIAFIRSKAAFGNSNSAIQYAFDDATPLMSRNHYRLKQLDNSNRSAYSNTVLLQGQMVMQLKIGGVYPNPVINVLNIILLSPKQENMQVMITGLDGKVWLQRNMSVITGDNYLKMDVSRLAAGNYLIKAVSESGETCVTRFVK